MAISTVNANLVGASRVIKLVDLLDNPLTTAQKSALAALIGAQQTGLSVWDTDLNMLFYWNGITFVPLVPANFRQVGANYTVTTNLDRVIECTVSNLSITLPSAIGIAGKDYVIKQSGTAINTTVIATGQTIDGSATIMLTQVNESRTLISNGANWLII